MITVENGIAAADRNEIINTDDKDLLAIKGINQYRKLQLLNIKYGRPVVQEADLKKGKMYFGGLKILNLQAGSILNIKYIAPEEDRIVIEGIERLNAAGRDYRLLCRTETGSTYEAAVTEYSNADIYGFAGELALRGSRYRFEIPACDSTRIRFYAAVSGSEIELHPAFDKYLGPDKEHENSYAVRNGYILTCTDGELHISRDSQQNRRSAEKAYEKEMVRENGLGWIIGRRSELKKLGNIEIGAVRNQVAFISTRSTDTLLGNMKKVYDRIDLPKKTYSKLGMSKSEDFMQEALELIAESKVIVTDDYLTPLRTYNKKKGQYIVQLWHATGAGKKFGQDGSNLFPAVDKLYHRSYDAVTVSAEGIRQYYAGAFDIPVSRVIATGVARTDDFFSREYSEEAIKRVYSQHPELDGKHVIMYAPTFRDLPGIPRSDFDPEIDFDRLSGNLRDDQIFVICPHPVMTEPIIGREYGNITEVRDVSSNDMMFVSERLITDYSSVMFEYALLGKPMAFYCYDYDTYNRDFYMDFDSELPGPLLRTQDELQDYLAADESGGTGNYRDFCEKYLGACDGHSTERIAALIEEFFRK